MDDDFRDIRASPVPEGPQELFATANPRGERSARHPHSGIRQYDVRVVASFEVVANVTSTKIRRRRWATLPLGQAAKATADPTKVDAVVILATETSKTPAHAMHYRCETIG